MKSIFIPKESQCTGPIFNTGISIASSLLCFCPFIPNHAFDALPTLPAGIPITDPRYFSQMSLQELAHILRSDNETPMPMLQERHQVLTSSHFFYFSWLLLKNNLVSVTKKLASALKRIMVEHSGASSRLFNM